MQYGLVRCEHNRPHWKTECVCPTALLFNARQSHVRSNRPLYCTCKSFDQWHCIGVPAVCHYKKSKLWSSQHAGSDEWVRIWVITMDLRVESLLRSFRFKRVIAVSHFRDSESVMWIIDMKDIYQEQGWRKVIILFLLTEFKRALTSRGMVNGKRLSYKRLYKKAALLHRIKHRVVL